MEPMEPRRLRSLHGESRLQLRRPSLGHTPPKAWLEGFSGSTSRCKLWALVAGTRVVRSRQRAVKAGETSSEDLKKQWEEFYEKDERDAREGWAIDIFDDDRLLKVIMTPSPRKSRVVRPMMCDKVTISYQWGLDGEKSIDSCDSFTFRVGHGDAPICGLDEAVLTMSEGEVSHFFIAPDLAYGEGGRDGVPPNASLEYEIHLLKVVDMDPEIEEFDDDFEIPDDLDKMGENDLGKGGQDETYRWERHGQDMLVWIPISESTTSKEIDCLLLKTHINAEVAGQVIFDGVPGLDIDEDESYWEIEMDSTGQRCLCIHLRKDHEFQRWPPKLLK